MSLNSDGWHGFSCLRHHLLTPRVHMSRKLESEAQQGLEPRPASVSGGIFTAVLAACPKESEVGGALGMTGTSLLVNDTGPVQDSHSGGTSMKVNKTIRHTLDK